MKHWARDAAIGLAFLAGAAWQPFLSAPAQAQEDPAWIWQFYVDELELESTWIARFEKPLQPGDFVLRHVTVVNLPEGSLSKDFSVTMHAGKIAWVGPDGAVEIPEGYEVIDGQGRFVVPGLVDMHTHTLVTSANYLTLLGSGVTTIREMDGFPWLLARKHQAESGQLFAPSMFITGQILNRNAFGGFARAVNTPEEARAAVREQAAEGYEAIKIHNSLGVELFDAIIDEARRVGLDVVGHIPQPVSVAHALESGLRTAEHFKGYIDDATLTLSKADWVSPTLASGVYLTPTFHTYREHLRGDAALEILNGPEGHLVHPRLQAQWRSAAALPVDALTRKRQNILPMSKEIFQTLLPHEVRWLAGTDSGSYNFMVPGPALLEELEMMQDFGLSTLETLKAATTNAAAAMHWENRIGRVAPGLQADLLLLRANPLESVRNLRSLEAMVLRGTWIAAAPALRGTAATIWSKGDSTPARPSPREIAAHVQARQELERRGYAFNHFQLDEIEQLLVGLGEEDQAAQVKALRFELH